MRSQNCPTYHQVSFFEDSDRTKPTSLLLSSKHMRRHTRYILKFSCSCSPEMLPMDAMALHSQICCVNPHASNVIPQADTSGTVDGRIFWSLQNIGRQWAMASVSSERICQRKSFCQLRLDENDGYEGNWKMNDLGMLNQNRVCAMHSKNIVEVCHRCRCTMVKHIDICIHKYTCCY